MGADLYIYKLFNPLQKKTEPAFKAACEARDSLYNELGGDACRSEIVKNQKYIDSQSEVDKTYNAMYTSGYFRDNYNDSSVLWQLGLSWWKDVGALLNNRHNLTGKNLIKFRRMVAKASLKTEDYPGDPRDVSNKDYFIRRKHALLEFLSVAIKKKYTIHCSI